MMEVRTLSWTDHKPRWWDSIHHSRSQILTVMAMTITANRLLPRLKCGCNGGYDRAVKGPSVIVLIAQKNLLEYRDSKIKHIPSRKGPMLKAHVALCHLST
jgi:hypothetical protein